MLRAAAAARPPAFSTSSSGPPSPVSNPLTRGSGDWYDTGNIESRLKRKRGDIPLSPTGEPLGRTGLSLGQPTEEELYLQAGVPGYAPGTREQRVAPPPPPPDAAADLGAYSGVGGVKGRVLEIVSGKMRKYWVH